MPTTREKAKTVLTSKKVLLTVGACAGAALAVLQLWSEASVSADALIVTESEAADLLQEQRSLIEDTRVEIKAHALQQQIDNLTDKIAIETLRLKHAENPGQRAERQALLRWYETQLRYYQCQADPRLEDRACQNLRVSPGG